MKMPATLLGFIRGPVRFESCAGLEWFPVSVDNNILINEKPVENLGRTYTISHIQKRSRFGFLLQVHERWWQLCFHVWYAWKFQEPAKPGSEEAFYFRIGWSRWDGNLCDYVKWPIGFGTLYLGLHYD